ncbi:MAG TPA: sulfur carrier protein ThiS [Planctomycetes bacterium]|nr:sulfur carrier protein ThiS [Planctomycetota bacterium]
MKILLNGESRELPEGSTIATLVASLDLRPEQVAVERNRELVPRAEHATTALAEGDELEVVTLVGGG